jgi:hypothetical protein
METGSYRSRKIDWSKLRVTKVPMTFYSDIGYGTGCGADCLSLLTGENPLRLQTKSGHYPDKYMLKILKQHGIDAYKLTKSNLTNTPNVVYNLDDRHVILACQLLQKATASWMIFFRRQIWHNFEATKAEFYSLINFPILSAYCLHSNKWK